MNIHELHEKSKSLVREWRKALPGEERVARYYTAALIILVGLCSFGLGRLSVLGEQREPVRIEITPEAGEKAAPAGVSQSQSASVSSSVSGQKLTGSASSPPPPTSGGKLVASRNGTKYYFPWCGSAAKIAEANKVWFNSEADARARGYTPAANCKGLK